MKQIVVLSGKGGTGKTSVSAALSQLAGDKAIFADCDVDAPNLHLILNPTNNKEETFYSGKLAIKDEESCINCGKCLEVCRFGSISADFKIDEMSCEGCGFCSYVCPEGAISMVPQISGQIFDATTRFGPFIHALLRVGGENSGKLVAAVIDRARKKTEDLDKEFLIVDGSPGVGCPVIAALSGANLVVMVTEPTKTAVHDMKRLSDLITHFKIKQAVVINKSTINLDQRNNIISYCEENDIPIVGEIPYNKQIYTAFVNGYTILEQDLSIESDSLTSIWEKIIEL